MLALIGVFWVWSNLTGDDLIAFEAVGRASLEEHVGLINQQDRVPPCTTLELARQVGLDIGGRCSKIADAEPVKRALHMLGC